MESKAFPPPQGARLPILGPLPARSQPANGIPSSVVGGVRRKRGPAGRETTHPLTISLSPRPDPTTEQQSNATTGPTTKVENHGLSFTSSASLADIVLRATDLLSLQSSSTVQTPEKAN